MFKRAIKRALLPDYTEAIARIRAALLKGDLSENGPLDDQWSEIDEASPGLFGDSLDRIEILMALEELNIRVTTVGELISFLELFQRKRDKELC